MRVKNLLSDVQMMIAEIEVSLNGTLRSSATLCAVVNSGKGDQEQIIPLNTPDGRPVLMSWDNAITAPK
jgi:hypothetical protein